MRLHSCRPMGTLNKVSNTPSLQNGTRVLAARFCCLTIVDSITCFIQIAEHRIDTVEEIQFSISKTTQRSMYPWYARMRALAIYFVLLRTKSRM